MLDVVIGAILIITVIDVRGKYTLSRPANPSGETRRYVFASALTVKHLHTLLIFIYEERLRIMAGTSTRNHYAVSLLEVSRLTNNQISPKNCIEI